MQRKRIAAVTAGLIVAGAVFGTIAGLVVLAAWFVLVDGFDFSNTGFRDLLMLSTLFGGTLGAVLGPLAAWGLMRHVPLWLAVGGTTLGTLAGGVLGFWVTGMPDLAMLWGMMGFGAMAIGLRLGVPRKRRLTSG